MKPNTFGVTKHSAVASPKHNVNLLCNAGQHMGIGHPNPCGRKLMVIDKVQESKLIDSGYPRV